MFSPPVTYKGGKDVTKPAALSHIVSPGKERCRVSVRGIFETHQKCCDKVFVSGETRHSPGFPRTPSRKGAKPRFSLICRSVMTAKGCCATFRYTPGSPGRYNAHRHEKNRLPTEDAGLQPRMMSTGRRPDNRFEDTLFQRSGINNFETATPCLDTVAGPVLKRPAVAGEVVTIEKAVNEPFGAQGNTPRESARAAACA